jgi:hypothetical protein
MPTKKRLVITKQLYLNCCQKADFLRCATNIKDEILIFYPPTP